MDDADPFGHLPDAAPVAATTASPSDDSGDPFAHLPDAPAMTPQEQALRRGERPAYLGPDNEFYRLSHLAEDQLGIRDEMIGAGQYARNLVSSGGDWDAAKKAYNDALEYARADKRIAREKEGGLGTAAEITGGLGMLGAGKSIVRGAQPILSPLGKSATAAPIAARPFAGSGALEPAIKDAAGNLMPASQATNAQVQAANAAAPGIGRRVLTNAGAGAAFGAEKGFAEGEGGFENRLENAKNEAEVGAIAGPIVGEVIPGALGVGKYALGVANRAIGSARNPQLGGDRQIVDSMREAGVSPDQLANGVVPPVSNNLAGRGFTQQDIGTAVSRQLNGETAAQIAPDYAHLVDQNGNAVTPATLRNYFLDYVASNPTRLNIMDLTDLVAGQGSAQPMTRLGRTNAIISRDGQAAQAIINRQLEQPGRVAAIVQQSGNGRNYIDRINELRTALKTDERNAYAQARVNAQLLDLAQTLDDAHAAFPLTGETHNAKMNDAINLFYQHGYVDDGAGGTRFTRLQQPVEDVDSFLKQRAQLDDLIADSYKANPHGVGQVPTHLTADLTEFRTAVNDAARANNADLVKADALFSGNRAAQNLLNQGADMALTLKANRDLPLEFNRLTPAQQELVRVGFERNLYERALQKQEGAAAANQFQTPAFKELVNVLYPPPNTSRAASAADRALSRQVSERGQDLIRNAGREAITTRTKNNIFGNSVTGQATFDLGSAMEGAYTAAHALTGNFMGLFHDLGKMLARQIGQRQATHVIRTLSETDPATMLQHLQRLSGLFNDRTSAEQFQQITRRARQIASARGVLASNATINATDQDRGQNKNAVPAPKPLPPGVTPRQAIQDAQDKLSRNQNSPRVKAAVEQKLREYGLHPDLLTTDHFQLIAPPR